MEEGLEETRADDFLKPPWLSNSSSILLVMTHLQSGLNGWKMKWNLPV